MVRKQRKDDVPARQPADLPSRVKDLDPVVADALLAGLPLQESRAQDMDLSGRKLSGLVAAGSLLDHVSFANGHILSSRLRDVRLVQCDFSHAVLRGFEATRVECIDCRLIGMKAIECRWKDVLIENCDVRYAQFNDGHVHHCEFKASNLSE